METKTEATSVGIDDLDPGDDCPNGCGETLLAGSSTGDGRVACDKCQTYWD